MIRHLLEKQIHIQNSVPQKIIPFLIDKRHSYDFAQLILNARLHTKSSVSPTAANHKQTFSLTTITIIKFRLQSKTFLKPQQACDLHFK